MECFNVEVQIAELYSFIWYFIFYSFFGWCCEVVFCSINTGKFVNRGFLNGPLCPIYGFGSVTILYTLQALENNLLLLFLGSALLCSLLELVAGYLLKTLFHASWWNYSDQPLNLGGYICLKFSLLWGAGCVILVHLIHPAVQVLIKNIPLNVCYVLLVAFYSILVFDLILTIIEIAKLNHDG